MHTINTGKEHVVFAQISDEVTILPIESCEIIFRQDVALENNQKAELIIVKKDDPSKLISQQVTSSVRPADRAFIHSVDRNFTQTQLILVGMVDNGQAKEVTLFTCMVTDIIPNGYL